MARVKILSEAARPKLKLFLSADIVGSTAYKQPLQRSAFESPQFDWAGYIQRFYNELSSSFVDRWNIIRAYVDEAYGKKHGAAATRKFLGDPPRFWKTVGDEVLFWKELRSEDQIWFTLLAWLEVIAQTRSWLTEIGLDVKTSAWVAGFPARNRVIANSRYVDESSSSFLQIYSDEQVSIINEKLNIDRNVLNYVIIDQYYKTGRFSEYVDFIGSGIDAGFRIGSLATTRKMSLGIELVYLMSLSVRHGEIATCLGKFNRRDLPLTLDIGRLTTHEGWDELVQKYLGKVAIYYNGFERLKGVVGDADYPVFWINTERPGSLDSLKSDLNVQFIKSQSWDILEKFCINFFKDRKNFLIPPFIHKASGARSHTATSYEAKEFDARLRLVQAGMGLI